MNMHNVLQVTGILSALSMVRWRNLSPCEKMHYQDWKEHVVACARVTIKKGYDASFVFYSSNGHLENIFWYFCFKPKHLAQTLHIDSHICCCVLPVCLFHFTFSQGSTKGLLDRWFWEKCIFNQLIHWWKFSLLDPLRISKVWRIQFLLRKGLPTVLAQTQHHCA